EPTRNLDVTIQAGILLLFKELQRELGLTILFIVNNLGLVFTFCDKAAVLKEGRIIERGTVNEVLFNPSEEYSKILIAASSKTLPKYSSEKGDVLLSVSGLKKYFPVVKRGAKGLSVKAVDGVDMKVRAGEVVGIVGESGCGKSTLVNTILHLHAPTEGRVVFDGDDIFALKGGAMREARKKIQIVFQDPYWSLNPRWLVRDIIAEPLAVHEKISSKEQLDRVSGLLNLVGLKPEHAFLYPHEFSGGERQRIAIARSLAVSPKLVVLDEPTSAIDIISQTQILKLINELRERFKLTNLLISHDLGVVSHLADRIFVMYLGRVVESGYTADIFKSPAHPYTKALFDSIPSVEKGAGGLRAIAGEIPSALYPPSGCHFHTRCPMAKPECAEIAPRTVPLANGHEVSCLMC
ncbi:MAG: ATP-binding cassette domain-containing protein, partial [Synergistaceae bacterium]|nr:ATP-binding cassette domain-containing protein [Synergistaceae bacterium]